MKYIRKYPITNQHVKKSTKTESKTEELTFEVAIKFAPNNCLKYLHLRRDSKKKSARKVIPSENITGDFLCSSRMIFFLT